MTALKRYFILLVCLSGWGHSLSLRGQSNFFSFRHITTEQGLSQDFVTGLAQDRFGFMWFGTNDGLTRFDGTQCRIFRHESGDSTSLPDSRIFGLSTDPKGRLWISTLKGVCLMDPLVQKIERLNLTEKLYGKPGPEHVFSTVSFDKRGNGWTFSDSFLIRIDLNTFQIEKFVIPAERKPECQVFADSKDRIWIIFSGWHMLRFDVATQQFTYMRGSRRPNGQLRPWAMIIQEDSHGTIWNSDWDQAFYTFNETTQEFENVPDGGGIATEFLIEERDSLPPMIWSSGGTHGLWRLDCATMQRTDFPFNPRDPYVHNNTRVHAIYKDPKTGIVWIGTESGVEYYDPNGIRFGRVFLPEKPGQDQFFSVCALVPDLNDPDKYWIGVWGVGLFEWQRSKNTFNLFNVGNKGLSSNAVFDMAQDSRGYLWIAMAQGLERFDTRTHQRKFCKQQPPWDTYEDNALSVEVGPDGRIWSGNNRGGLVETDPASCLSKNIHLYHPDGSAVSKFTAFNLKIDTRGRIMMGNSEGLLRYDPATLKNEQLLRTTPILGVNDAVNGKDKRLYVGTTEGVYILNEKDSLLFTLKTENGLRSQDVRQIDVDAAGIIWIATTNGLHRYTPESGRIDYYSKADGLFLNDLSQSFNILSNGEMFITGEYSFNLAVPGELNKNIHAPRLALNGLITPERLPKWIPGRELVLTPDEAVISFDVAIIHFTQPDKTVLVYKLEGFDDDWTETHEHTITYTNLDGGKYTLLVRARNGDGVWSEDTLLIPFRVTPVFYKRWWFIGLMLVLLAGAVTGISLYRRQVRMRLEQVQSRTAELEKRQLINEIALLKTQVNPHFLFNSLSILSSLVHTDAHLSEQFIDQLSRSYRYILEQKDQTLVTIRTELEFIQSYAFLLKIRFEKKFDLRIQIPEAISNQYKIAPLTLQLLVENAVKHNRMSSKEPLVVDVYTENDILIVKNALRERASPEPSTGTGLNNIISRYALLTNRPVIAGKTDDGFFEVKVPLLDVASL